MRVSNLVNSAMKALSAAKYTKSNTSHLIHNTQAVNDFVKVHPSLSKYDRYNIITLKL